MKLLNVYDKINSITKFQEKKPWEKPWATWHEIQSKLSHWLNRVFQKRHYDTTHKMLNIKKLRTVIIVLGKFTCTTITFGSYPFIWHGDITHWCKLKLGQDCHWESLHLFTWYTASTVTQNVAITLVGNLKPGMWRNWKLARNLSLLNIDTLLYFFSLQGSGCFPSKYFTCSRWWGKAIGCKYTNTDEC